MNKQEIIERIMELKTDGLSFQQIADRFNAEDIPTFSGRGSWAKGTVGRIHKTSGKQSTGGKTTDMEMELNRVKQELAVVILERDQLKAELDKYHGPAAQLKVGGWSVQKSGGYYRAFRKHRGRQYGVYIGKQFDEAEARRKILEKYPDIGVD